MTVLPELAPGSVDMVLCDLPYGVLNKGNDSAAWDSRLDMEALWAEYHRICKPSAPIILFAQGMFTAVLMMSNPDEWRYNLVWDKILATGFLNADKMPLRSHEDILVFYREQPVYNPQMELGLPLHSKGKRYKNAELTNNCYGGLVATDDSRAGNREKYPTSVLPFQKPHPSVAVHPTQKPVNLLLYLILTYSNVGDTILDNTMGSGSTGVAAVLAERKFIGIEKEETYFSIAERRIREAEEDVASRLF